MRPAAFESALDQRARDETLDNAIMCSRLLAGLDHGHPGPKRGMAAYRRINGTVALHIAAHQRLVDAPDRPRLHLADQIGLRLKRPGNDHQAAGVFVQSMHNSGTGHMFERWRVMEQGIE